MEGFSVSSRSASVSGSMGHAEEKDWVSCFLPRWMANWWDMLGGIWPKREKGDVWMNFKGDSKPIYILSGFEIMRQRNGETLVYKIKGPFMND
jgi:hypothetical protein